MIRYQKLSYSDAKVIIAEYDSYDDNEFKDLENHWRANDVSASAFDPSYEDFRHELLAEFNSALVETSGKMTYLLDLRVGIKLFQLMPLDSIFLLLRPIMMIYGDISQLKLCPILHISDIQPQKKEVFGLIKNASSLILAASG